MIRRRPFRLLRVHATDIEALRRVIAKPYGLERGFRAELSDSIAVKADAAERVARAWYADREFEARQIGMELVRRVEP